MDLSGTHSIHELTKNEYKGHNDADADPDADHGGDE